MKILKLQSTGSALTDHFRCPTDSIRWSVTTTKNQRPGYFQFGPEAICYGATSASDTCTNDPSGSLSDVSSDIRQTDGQIVLPFDPEMVIDHLRLERYPFQRGGRFSLRSLHSFYYLVRPLLGTTLRSSLQRLYFQGWDKLPFPRWPVETSADDLLRQLAVVAMRAGAIEELPFIWFWPEGAQAAIILTHDVETADGVRQIPQLMDLDESFGLQASYQLVPEDRYKVSRTLLDEIRARNHEINIHDLNHDGGLFRDQHRFRERAEKINEYGRIFEAEGFRSACMYRNLDWLEDLEFAYDMSVPNVAHLEPQRGGCCTVFPYFIGRILELPHTTASDYALFEILREFSGETWERQIDAILKKHGLISVIAHPDYLRGNQAAGAYRNLLARLSGLKDRNVWAALPGEVNRWWRDRAAMELVLRNGRWCVEGPGAERARVAFARLESGHLAYDLQ